MKHSISIIIYTLACVLCPELSKAYTIYEKESYVVDGLVYHLGDNGNAAIDLECFKNREEITIPAKVIINGTTYNVDATYGRKAYNWEGKYPNYTYTSSLTVKRIIFEDSDVPFELEENYMDYFDGTKMIEDWDGEGPCKAGYDYYSLTSPFFLSEVEEVYIGRDIKFSPSRYLSADVFKVVKGIFLYCDKLSNVTIGPKVTYLAEGFFKHCTSLTSLTIPGTVSAIDKNLISQCKNLKTLTLEKSENPLYVFGELGSSGIEIFNFDRPLSTGSMTIFDETKESKGNLRDSYSLTTINFGKSISEVPEAMFQGCTNLQSITLPVNLTKIHDYAFNGCSRLRSINIEDSKHPLVIESSNGVDGRGTTFGGDPVEELYLGRNIEYSGTELSPFKNMTDLTIFTIGNDVSELNNYLMYGCSGLTMMSVPSSVKKLVTILFTIAMKPDL